MNSHDGDGSAKTLALGESIARAHRLGAEHCEIQLQIALTYLGYARGLRDSHVNERAVANARQVLASVRKTFPRLQLTPAEEVRINDLMNMVEAFLESDAEGQ